MRIDLQSLGKAGVVITQIADALVDSGAKLQSPVSAGFSTIVGVSEAGGIHGQTLSGHSGSADALLRGLGERLNTIAQLLADNATAVDSQDQANSTGLALADHGGQVEDSSVSLSMLSEIPADPILVASPIVNVGASLEGLDMALKATSTSQLTDTAHRWVELSAQLGEVKSTIQSTVEELSGANDADFVNAAADALGQVANSAGYFMDHALAMAARADKLAGIITIVGYNTHAASFVIGSVPDPVLKSAAEQGLLSLQQQMLQSGVTGSIPPSTPMVMPAEDTSGDIASVGLDSIAGPGHRYNTDDLVWPQEFIDAIDRGDVGPGSFEVTDGAITGLRDVGGMSQSAIADTVATANAYRDYALAEAGYRPPTGMAGLDAVGTHAAGAQPVGGNGSGMHLSPNTTSFGTSSSVNGLPSQLGAGGSSLGSASLGALTGAGLGSPNGAGRVLSPSVGGGLPVSGSGSGAAPSGGAPAGTHPGASASGGGLGGGSHATAGSHPRGVTGAHGSAGGYGAGSPGRYGKGEGKKIKTVTSRVEINKNKRDLLGQRKAVVPGVLGSWIRQQ